ncbi:mitochondrial import inner membrane translocase subunit Tim21 [Ischnura elegans]|uniref:mitochondrial import inner membrane translocase subunit Tim21 n=1 Tax=Ischnura elegans TaxID=197161 RepID=UPI001ED8BFBF|nr:mitochondrial import inner membrane translocase subunit Tim21 [Ischnura elegans]
MMSIISSFKCTAKFTPRQCLTLINHVKTGSCVTINQGIIGERYYASERKHDSSSLTRVKTKDQISTTVKEVKETTKTVSYLGVILFGVGVTGFILFTVFKELFSSNSPNSIYTAALEKCRKDPRVVDLLGDPIKGFGEETRRGRRRHVSHIVYERDGIQYLRMKFYVQGIRRQGTVHLEMKKNDSGNFEYRYLFVQLDTFPRDTVILEDNRSEKSDLASLT